MLDKIVEALHSELLRSWPADRSYRPADFDTGGLPKPIATILLDHLERSTLDELRSLDPTKLTWVDRESPQIAEAFERMRESVRSNRAIPAERWSELVKLATSKTVAAFLMPREELASLIYDEEEQELATPVVTERLHFRYGHESLREALVDALNKKNLDLITRERFSTIVGKVDELRTESFGLEDWIRELLPIAALTATEALPAPVLTEYLAERGFTRAAGKVGSAGGDNLTIEELLNLTVESPEDSEVRPVEGIGEAARLLESPTESSAASVGDGPVPLWRRFQKNLNEPISGSSKPITPGTKPGPSSLPVSTPGAENGPSKRPAVTPAAEQPAEPEEKIQQPLWKRFRSGDESRTATSSDTDESPADPEQGSSAGSSGGKSPRVSTERIEELEVRVLGKEGVKARGSFIDDLFKGAESDYLEIVEELHTATSWGEASQVIAERVFKRNQVNIYSQAAVAFTNAVEARFRSAKVPG